MTTPRSTPSRGVYAVRRLVALAVLAALVTGIVLLGQLVVRAVQPLFAESEETSVKMLPPDPDDGPDGPPEDCTVRDLELVVSTSKAEYAPGELVQLTSTVTHVGRTACLLDGSDVARYVVVTSDGERVWSSADCADGERMLLLGPGDSVPAQHRWRRGFSSPECEKGLPSATPGTYEAHLELAGLDDAVSDPVRFELAEPPEPQVPRETDEPEGADGTGDEAAEGTSTGDAASSDDGEDTTGHGPEDEPADADPGSDEQAG